MYRVTRRDVRRAAVLGIAAALLVPASARDEGWLIERFHLRLAIQPDGTLGAEEAIDVDFRGLARRGIFRDMAYLFDYNPAFNREYEIDLAGVTAADGRRHQVLRSTEGATQRLRIGDPNRTITGKETYRLAYTVRYALNGFPDHDVLFWNATGTWPVGVAQASVDVAVPAGAITKVDCFQGPRGSKERCASRLTKTGASYAATRLLAEGEQLTVVAALSKGVFAEPVPRLVPKGRTGSGPGMTPADFFHVTPLIQWMTAAGGAAGIAGLVAVWWRVGRDRQHVALYHAGEAMDRAERVPFFGGARPIAVEFEPPERLRPAQVGLLIDERADTLDVTATIIDLAVRGYLRITALEKTGWFGKADWQLDRLKPADASLLEYERIVFEGLFDGGSRRTLSDLKNEFHTDLEKAKRALYRDAVERKWFPRSPNSVRTWWRVGGLFVMFVGVGLIILLGARFGAGLLALPVIAVGLVAAILSSAMPRRTAAGRHLMQRALGFARYMRTAETAQQAFAERANIFTGYLPYAVAFRCVDRWASAFKDLDLRAATGGWYAGSAPFSTATFSSSLGSFSSSVTSAIASTPGGSGGSGFSGGGSSGGGGGGGGGGSW